MSDLTIENHWHCESMEYFARNVKGSNGNFYTVRWDRSRHQNSDVDYDYSCTCQSYKFGKGKHCKHIKEVISSGEHCKWSKFIDGGDVDHRHDGEPCCPMCGANVYSQRWAV